MLLSILVHSGRNETQPGFSAQSLNPELETCSRAASRCGCPGESFTVLNTNLWFAVLAGKVVVVAVISKPPSLLVSIAVVDSQHKGSTSAPTIGKL